MLPIVITTIVGIVITGYTLRAIGVSIGDFQDPHGYWDEEEEDDGQ